MLVGLFRHLSVVDEIRNYFCLCSTQWLHPSVAAWPNGQLCVVEGFRLVHQGYTEAALRMKQALLLIKESLSSESSKFNFKLLSICGQLS